MTLFMCIIERNIFIINTIRKRKDVGLFVKAKKSQRKLKLALCGVSGSGKTYTALTLAKGICPEGKRVFVMDSEKHSSSLYADRFDFDVLDMSNHDPREYMRMIRAAEKEGCGVLVIDSLSHEWQGTGGYLDIMDSEAKKIKGGNTFAANKVPAELHKQLIDTITGANIAIICTLRSKKKYLDMEENGRKVKKVVGMEPVTKEGTDFEFDVFAEMDLDGNTFIVEKTRIFQLNGMVKSRPDEELGRYIVSCLNENVEVAEEIQAVPVTPVITEEAKPKVIKRTVQAPPVTEPEYGNTAYDDVPDPLPVDEAVKSATIMSKMQVDDLKAMAKQTGYNQDQFLKVLNSLGILDIKAIPASLFGILSTKYRDKGLLLGL